MFLNIIACSMVAFSAVCVLAAIAGFVLASSTLAFISVGSGLLMLACLVAGTSAVSRGRLSA